MLERFRAKACPALDAGWVPVRVKKTRQNKRLQNKRLEPPFRFNSERKRLQRSSRFEQCSCHSRSICPAISGRRSADSGWRRMDALIVCSARGRPHGGGRTGLGPTLYLAPVFIAHSAQ